MIIGYRAEWYFGSRQVWHSSEARVALGPPVSVKDRPLHWVLDRSQTYYLEHILVYGRREDLLLSLSWVPAFTGPTFRVIFGWRSSHRAESGIQGRGLGVQVWTGTCTL